MTAYAIICDARGGQELGIDTLAMVDRSKTTAEFWTSDKTHLIMRFLSPKVATKVADRLRHNRPRVVEYDFARGVIERQNSAISARACE
jgi:hypothetical protein